MSTALFRETRLMKGKTLEVTELVTSDRVRLVSFAGGILWDSLCERPEGPATLAAGEAAEHR